MDEKALNNEIRNCANFLLYTFAKSCGTENRKIVKIEDKVEILIKSIILH